MRKKSFAFLVIVVFFYVSAYSQISLQLGCTNVYSVGSWTDYIDYSFGGGGGVEYSLPLDLGAAELGVQLKSEFLVLIPKEAGYGAINDVTILPGVFISVPFMLDKARVCAHPELACGVDIHLATNDQGKKVYTDFLLYAALPIRWQIPFLQMLDLEFAPAYLFMFEKNNVLAQFGFRTGLVWNIN
jgi:hypothetical protein